MKYVFYLLGILILTLGISFTIQSDLGTSPFDALVTAFITGIGIDMWLFLLNNLIEPTIWFSKLFCFGVGLIVIGLGTSIYLQTNFAPIPVDRLTLILQALTRSNILLSRTFIYLFFLIMAIIFNGIGSLLTVCLGGIILNFFMPLTQKALAPLLTTGDSTANFSSSRSYPQ